MSGRPQAVPIVQVDNAKVIVTEWRLALGVEIGRHCHGYDHVVVSLTGGTLLLKTPEGDRRVPLVAGQAYFHKAGVEHDVASANTYKVVFVETEIK